MSDKSDLAALGKRIRKLREARGMSQEEAARVIGLDRSYYGRIERGTVNVSALNLLRIAAGLKSTVGSFFPGR
jgi:transcriptional regulator with XRE-family HTH domain